MASRVFPADRDDGFMRKMEINNNERTGFPVPPLDLKFIVIKVIPYLISHTRQLNRLCMRKSIFIRFLRTHPTRTMYFSFRKVSDI